MHKAETAFQEKTKAKMSARVSPEEDILSEI